MTMKVFDRDYISAPFCGVPGENSVRTPVSSSRRWLQLPTNYKQDVTVMCRVVVKSA